MCRWLIEKIKPIKYNNTLTFVNHVFLLQRNLKNDFLAFSA